MTFRMRLRDKPGPPQYGHNMHILNGHERLRFVAANIKPGRILDAGCGEGAFSLWAAKQGYIVHAIDLFGDPTKRLHDAGVLFTRTSIEDYNTEFRYDTIFFMEVVEHLEDPIAAVDKLLELLVDSGRILITTPHIGDWDWEEDHIWRWPTVNDFTNDFSKFNPIVFQDKTFIYAVVIKDV